MTLPLTAPNIDDIPRVAFDDPEELYKHILALTTTIRALQLDTATRLEDEAALYELLTNKDVASGYAGLSAGIKLATSQLPSIGWRLDKNGTNQTSVGTGATKITWTSAGSKAIVSGVTFSDVNDRITLTTAGNYLVLASVFYAIVADQDDCRTLIYKNGSVYTEYTIGAASNQFASGIVFDVIASDGDDYVEIFGTNVDNADTVLGTDTLTTFMGFYLGPAS